MSKIFNINTLDLCQSDNVTIFSHSWRKCLQWTIKWLCNAWYLHSRISNWWQVARENLNKAAERNKCIYNSKLLVHHYEPGNIVWMLNDKTDIGVCQKLQPAYYGPCIVIAKFSDLVFKVQVSADGTTKVVNHDKLLPYRGISPPKWILRISAKILRRSPRRQWSVQSLCFCFLMYWMMFCGANKLL